MSNYIFSRKIWGVRKYRLQQSNMTYRNMKGTDKPATACPKISDSCAILKSTLLAISPKYIPEIIFSKPCKNSSIMNGIFLKRICKEQLKCKIIIIITSGYSRTLPGHYGLGSHHPGQRHRKFLADVMTKNFPIPCW